MDIIITGEETIGDVKEQFAKLLPMLKLEFFHHEHKQGEGSPMSDKIDDDARLDEIRTQKKEGSVEFTRQMKISELEAMFRDKFGLNVQVFRKSGSIWLEIITTDQRTLEEENEWAIEMSHPPEKNNNRNYESRKYPQRETPTHVRPAF